MNSLFNLPSSRIACLALVAIWCGGEAAIAGEQVATRFEMLGIAGMRVLDLRTLTEEDGEGYSITADFATQGIAHLFVDMTSHAQVRGRIVDGSVQPEWYRSEVRRNGVERLSRIDYRPDGIVDTATTPPLSAPIAAGELRGTVDNLTAYFQLERQLAQTGRCALTARVFDGRHGYDLVFSDAGRQALAPAAGQNFAGDAIACAMVRRDWSRFPDPEKDEGARQGTVWYARMISGELPVPVRMRLATHIGTVEGFLAELHGSGVDLALME
jgi:Protein of unknown function (DUF3108)